MNYILLASTGLIGSGIGDWWPIPARESKDFAAVRIEGV
jgi:hypothetical protein